MNQNKLKEIFHYDPDTGVFTNHLYRGSSAGAGAIAGSVTNGTGHRIITINAKKYLAHRLAWLYMTGGWPHSQIDHINGVKDDNRISNLRDADQAQNMKNTKTHCSNTSGFRGVRWNKAQKKWIAYLGATNSRGSYLGSFKTIVDAVAARMRAERELGYHINHGRTL